MARYTRRDPFHFCPICGVSWNRHNGPCKPSVLSAIDAANTRALRGDDSASDGTWYPEPRDYSLRLRDGFRMLSESEVEA